MFYHILIENDWGTKNIFDLDINNLRVLIKAYDEGSDSFFVNGEKYFIDTLRKLKIFRTARKYQFYSTRLSNISFESNSFINNDKFVSEKGFQQFAEDLTSQYLKGGFGEKLKYYELDDDSKALMVIEALERLNIKTENNHFSFETIAEELIYPLEKDEVEFICDTFETKDLGKKIRRLDSQGFFFKEKLFRYKYDPRFKKIAVAKAQINDNGPKKEFVKNEFGVDIAFITALMNDELKYIANHIENSIDDDSNSKKLIQIGVLRAKPSIKVLYTSLLNTGMVDASITATEIILKYNPKIIIMTGVCGGREKDDYKLKDIIIAKSIYTFQKGKQTDQGFEPENEVLNINGKLIQLIERDKENLQQKIQYTGKIHIGSMACSTYVINAKGHFEEIVKSNDRKTVGLEMEGYGIARACDIVNNGKTECLIIKSIMDKTSAKGDEVKHVAAKHSADFAIELVTSGILDSFLSI